MTTTQRGTIRNVIVVFDGPVSPTAGTPVRVVPLPAGQSLASPLPYFHPVGSWEGPRGELDRLLADVQAMRDADEESERDA